MPQNVASWDKTEKVMGQKDAVNAALDIGPFVIKINMARVMSVIESETGIDAPEIRRTAKSQDNMLAPTFVYQTTDRDTRSRFESSFPDRSLWLYQKPYLLVTSKFTCLNGL